MTERTVVPMTGRAVVPMTGRTVMPRVGRVANRQDGDVTAEPVRDAEGWPLRAPSQTVALWESSIAIGVDWWGDLGVWFGAQVEVCAQQRGRAWLTVPPELTADESGLDRWVQDNFDGDDLLWWSEHDTSWWLYQDASRELTVFAAPLPVVNQCSGLDFERHAGDWADTMRLCRPSVDATTDLTRYGHEHT